MAKRKISFYGCRSNRKNINKAPVSPTKPYVEIVKNLSGITVTVYRWEVQVKTYNDSIKWIGPLTAYHSDNRYEYANHYVRETMTYVTDVYEDIPYFRRGMLCGTSSLVELDRWVNFRSAAILESDGFCIGIYEVPEEYLMVGKEQVAFDPNKALRIGSVPYGDVIRDVYGQYFLRLKTRFDKLKEKYAEHGRLPF